MDTDDSASGYVVILSPLAERFGRALVQRTRLLVTFPELGRLVPELGPTEQARELVHRAYRIIYRVAHSRRRVEVTRFWHAARGIPQF